MQFKSVKLRCIVKCGSIKVIYIVSCRLSESEPTSSEVGGCHFLNTYGFSLRSKESCFDIFASKAAANSKKKNLQLLINNNL